MNGHHCGPDVPCRSCDREAETRADHGREHADRSTFDRDWHYPRDLAPKGT